MDITKLHTVSFAARIGQVAASEITGLLQSPEGEVWTVEDCQNWFDRTLDLDAAGDVVEQLGEYVCQHQVEEGERLFRHATNTRLVAPIGDWAGMSFEQRFPWESFVDACRQAFNALKAAQLAIIDARKAAEPVAPATLAREDSIFEEEDDMFALRPEAVEALKLTGIYERGQIAEKERLAAAAEAQEAADRETFNGADPAAFDHDGDGRPGGSKVKRQEPLASAVDRSIVRHQRRTAKPKPLSAGEAMAKPPVNRGGRGNKKTP